MSKLIKVAVREYTETVRTKAFLIGILIAPIFMFGGILGMTLLKDHVDVTDKKIAIIDHSGIVAPALAKAAEKRNELEVKDPKTGEKIKPAYKFEIIPPAADPNAQNAQKAKLTERVKNSDITAYMVVGKKVAEVADNAAPGQKGDDYRITYHSENAAMDDVRRWVAQPVNDYLRSLRLSNAGLDDAQVKRLFTWTSVEAMGLVSVDAETGEIQDAEAVSELQAFGIPFVMLMLMFLMIMMGAMPLLNAVLEEKTQRIAEILLGSARPFDLMMGKLLGSLGVSFTASMVYVAGAIGAMKYMGMDSLIPYHLLPWFFIYIIAAIFMNGAIYIAVGAACSDLKETQSLVMPAMLPMMIPMFIMVPAIKEPTSAFITGLSLFPPCTPMLMLLRQATPGGIPMWQPWIGLLGVTLWTIACVWAAGRIFRVGLLMQGKAPKIPQLIGWIFKEKPGGGQSK